MGAVSDLQRCLTAQLAFQRGSFGTDPRTLEGEERAEYVRWNVLALEDELHEALAEVGWKPWATSRHLNRDEYVGELVDVFHFVLNLLLVADCDADEFVLRYFAKRQKNIERKENGYDGVSSKCPGCRREMSETSSHTKREDEELVTRCGQCGAEWGRGPEIRSVNAGG